MVKIPSGIPSQIKEYSGYTLSFNKKTHIPNWVAWELTAEEASGDTPRTKTFWTDREIKGCALPEDYRNSGYDRGHMAPAADMKWSPRAMEECFALSNICPQAKALNSGAWKRLEDKCRSRAIADSAIVIVCGPVPEKTPLAHIGVTGVAVPSQFFKAIISPFSNPPQGIGFIMPNEYVKGGIQPCAVSIDSIEVLTGFDLFSSLPDEVEEKVESMCNFPKWSHTR